MIIQKHSIDPLWSNVSESYFQHLNVVRFVLSNNIMVNNYSEYKMINDYFIRISLTRQENLEYTKFGQIELYACISYLDDKDLLRYMEPFYKAKSKLYAKFIIDDADKEWLIKKVLPNVAYIYQNKKSLFNTYEKILAKTLFLLSIINLKKDDMNTIINIIKNVIKDGNNTIDVYKSFNQFLGLQYSLFKTDIDDELLKDIIETLISKIAYGKFSGYDYMSIITMNQMSNFYGYAREKKTIIENIDLVNRFISEYKESPLSTKIEVAEFLLSCLYNNSSSEIVDRIIVFIKGIDLNEETVSERILVFELNLAIAKIDDDYEKINNDAKAVMEKYKEGNMFSSTLYSINKQFEYLIEKEGLEIFKEISTIVKEIITKSKDIGMESII